MDSKQFIAKILRLHPLQGVTIRFAEDGLAGLQRLDHLLRTKQGIRLAERCKIIMLAVLSSRRWEGSENRNYVVYGLAYAGGDWLYSLSKDVESVEPPDHLAKGVASRRQKTRQEAFASIANSIKTAAFVQEMASWEIEVEAELEEIEELPVATFRLTHNGKEIASAGIDGWSGRTLIDGQFDDGRYIKPQQIQQILRERMESVLDQMTCAG